MKIQSLAVIFVIIILPISIILSEYVHTQISTLSLQTSYDSKLLGATYDAVMALQKNTVNSNSSDITSSKMRDIEASANTFLNSIASNFGLSGNNREAIQAYVPAVVFTLYDGYYIYSRYTNFFDNNDGDYGDDTHSTGEVQVVAKSTYQNDTQLTGIKPYIYYSREYKKGADRFIITYSLDNYITIQGTINNLGVYEHGYIIDTNKATLNSAGEVERYRGFYIEPTEPLKEYIDDNKNTPEYSYVKVNGVKYYLDENYNGTGEKRVFSFLKNQREYLSLDSSNKFMTVHPFDDNSARKFYTEAYNFTNKVINEYNLGNLKSSNATDWDSLDKNAQTYYGNTITVGKQADYNIFQNISDIEYYNSDFNQERRAVIRYAIEKNLRTAIANYNNYSGSTNNFQMPNLKEDEWDKIINNICMISFLQGMNMGTKSYNGYAIVPNKKNEEFVAEDAIYITTTNGEYHKVTDQDLLTSGLTIKRGEFNMNFERKSIYDENGASVNYFYPHTETGCYSSIIDQFGVNSLEREEIIGGRKYYIPITIYEYLDDKHSDDLASKYYTALGRERKAIYRVSNIVETYTN